MKYKMSSKVFNHKHNKFINIFFNYSNEKYKKVENKIIKTIQSGVYSIIEL